MDQSKQKKEIKKLEKRYSQIEDSNKQLQQQVNQLQTQNQQLSQNCKNLEMEVARAKADARSKQDFMDKVDDLSHRICRIVDEKKNQESNFNASQQVDRDFFNKKILEIDEDLQVAKESIKDLISIIHQHDQECKNNANKLSAEMEKMKKSEQCALTAAGNYFHTYFPSIKSLQEHVETNPIIKANTQAAKPFIPDDSDLIHKNDVKKMKKLMTKIHTLKNKVEELQQTIDSSENLSDSLTKDNELLKKEISQLKMQQLAVGQEVKASAQKEENASLELEKANRKIKELETLVQRNLVQNAEKDANHRNELAQAQQQVEIEAEKGQKLSALKQKIREQQMIIDNQKTGTQDSQSKLNHLTDIQAQQVVQIAKLEADNQKKDDKLKDLKLKIKALKDIPTKVETQPVLHWDQVSSPEIPDEMQKSLAEIVENTLIPIEAKIKSALKTICAFYTAHQQNLSSFQSKYKTKYQKLQKSFSAFIAEVGKITLNRAIDFEEIYDSPDLQKDVLSFVKKYVSEIHELETRIRMMQISFPYDKLSSLQENFNSQANDLNELKETNKRLKKQLLRRKSSLSFQNVNIFTCENNVNDLHNEIKENKNKLNEFENKLKVANDYKSTAELKLAEEKKKFLDAQSKLFGAQKEIERMKKDIVEKEAQISNLNQKCRNQTINHLSKKVHKANDDREFFLNELNIIKMENFSKADYESTIHNLQLKVKLLEQELEDVQNGKNNHNKLAKKLRQLEQENEIAQNEIVILRQQNGVVRSDGTLVEDKKIEMVDSLKQKLQSSEKRTEKLQRRLKKIQEIIPQSEKANMDSSKRITELENKIAQLQSQIEEERKSFIKKIKEAKIDSINEYQALVDQLTKRCSIQKTTIETLSGQLKNNQYISK